jgi:hypothetical protein
MAKQYQSKINNPNFRPRDFVQGDVQGSLQKGITAGLEARKSLQIIQANRQDMRSQMAMLPSKIAQAEETLKQTAIANHESLLTMPYDIEKLKYDNERAFLDNQKTKAQFASGEIFAQTLANKVEYQKQQRSFEHDLSYMQNNIGAIVNRMANNPNDYNYILSDEISRTMSQYASADPNSDAGKAYNRYIQIRNNLQQSMGGDYNEELAKLTKEGTDKGLTGDDLNSHIDGGLAAWAGNDPFKLEQSQQFANKNAMIAEANYNREYNKHYTTGMETYNDPQRADIYAKSQIASKQSMQDMKIAQDVQDATTLDLQAFQTNATTAIENFFRQQYKLKIPQKDGTFTEELLSVDEFFRRTAEFGPNTEMANAAMAQIDSLIKPYFEKKFGSVEGQTEKYAAFKSALLIQVANNSKTYLAGEMNKLQATIQQNNPLYAANSGFGYMPDKDGNLVFRKLTPAEFAEVGANGVMPKKSDLSAYGGHMFGNTRYIFGRDTSPAGLQYKSNWWIFGNYGTKDIPEGRDYLFAQGANDAQWVSSARGDIQARHDYLKNIMNSDEFTALPLQTQLEIRDAEKLMYTLNHGGYGNKGILFNAGILESDGYKFQSDKFSKEWGSVKNAAEALENRYQKSYNSAYGYVTNSNKAYEHMKSFNAILNNFVAWGEFDHQVAQSKYNSYQYMNDLLSNQIENLKSQGSPFGGVFGTPQPGAVEGTPMQKIP